MRLKGSLDPFRDAENPFGEFTDIIDDVTAPIETKGWIGERYDEDARLQYLNARYYDPELGLFVQPDWWDVTKAGVGTNRYSYSFNDPVNLMDRGGNNAVCAAGLQAAAGCAGLAAISAYALGVAIIAMPDPRAYGMGDNTPRFGLGPLPGLVPPPLGDLNGEGMTPGVSVPTEVSTPAADSLPEMVETPIFEGTANAMVTYPTEEAGSLVLESVKPGTYVLVDEQGKVYVGKGDRQRMLSSIRRLEREHGVEVEASDWNASDTHREAFKEEDRLIQEYGGDDGVRSDSLYNKINSPGRRYRQQDVD